MDAQDPDDAQSARESSAAIAAHRGLQPYAAAGGKSQAGLMILLARRNLLVLAGLSPGVVLLAIVVAPMAVAESLCNTATTTILQTDPPQHLRGRVLGAWRSVSTCWQLAGPPLLGLLIQLGGARGALCAGGLVTAGAIGLTAIARRRRARPGLRDGGVLRRLRLLARSSPSSATGCP